MSPVVPRRVSRAVCGRDGLRWPRRDGKPSLRELVQYDERLAKTCDRIAATNEPHIELLGRVFTLASAAIIVEVLLWGLQLALS
jgi:hypothetical protein